MADPIGAHRLIGAGQGKVILDHRVGEERGVEIQADMMRLGKRHPGDEVLGAQLIALALAADGVAGVQVQPLAAGNQRQCGFKIARQLLKRAGAAGIIARHLDAAVQRTAQAFQAGHVVALPAVNAHGNGRERLQGLFRIYANVRVAAQGQLIAFVHGKSLL